MVVAPKSSPGPTLMVLPVCQVSNFNALRARVEPDKHVDIKPFTTLVPQPGGHFGASECVSKLSGSLPAGQQPNKTQVIEGHVRRVPPMIQVLGSKDILPIILGCLRQSFSEWERWRSAFASILRVNRSFAWAGIGILWHTMTSIVPALKLLPWYGNSGYQGLGVSLLVVMSSR